jgi:hypothetical protein
VSVISQSETTDPAEHLAAAGSSFRYKYYRKNSDGSITCNANRSLTIPFSVIVNLNDSWN